MSILRRLAVLAVRKLLPEAVPDNPGSALVLRSDAQLAPLDRSNSFPLVRPPQTLYAPPVVYAPPPAPPVVYAPPPPRRRRRKVTVTETFTHWRG